MNANDFMRIWQSRYGTLLHEFRDDFLTSEITQQIVQFEPEQIKAAVKQGDASLSGILKMLKSGIYKRSSIKPISLKPGRVKSTKPKVSGKNVVITLSEKKSVALDIDTSVNFIPSDYYLVEPGAYKLGHTVYSIRRDKKTRVFQAWFHDQDKKTYRRPFFESDERKILEKLTSADRLTLRMAEKYSLETGMCCHCGRTLTATKSITRGMGPVCRSLYH
jgi:hypothetical protein